MKTANLYSTDTLEKMIEAFASLGIYVETREISEYAKLPENLCYLALNEMVLNAMRAALWFRWAGKGDAWICIKARSNEVSIVNTATEEDIESRLTPPERPLGKASGWGRWATREMINLAGWN